MGLNEAKSLLLRSDPTFWSKLKSVTDEAAGLDELISCSTLRKKAVLRGLWRADFTAPPLRLAVLGGCSLYPLHELLTHLLDVAGITSELFLGDYDNYVAEIMDADSQLYAFRPDVVLLLPGVQRSRYPGALTDSRDSASTGASMV